MMQAFGITSIGSTRRTNGVTPYTVMVVLVISCPALIRVRAFFLNRILFSDVDGGFQVQDHAFIQADGDRGGTEL